MPGLGEHTEYSERLHVSMLLTFLVATNTKGEEVSEKQEKGVSRVQSQSESCL